MKHYFITTLYLVTFLCAVFTTTSCKESDDSVEEFPNWKATNEAAFRSIYGQAVEKAAAGDASWKVIRQWSMPAEPDIFPLDPEDHIVVQVLESGTGSGCPIFTQSVKCHYQGRLLPSTSYKDGLVFDQSYYDTFNEATSAPATLQVNGVVDGFSTALQNMHIGDYWRVYIPYQLGYKEAGQGSIPGYSTLVFDIRLVSYGSVEE